MTHRMQWVSGALFGIALGLVVYSFEHISDIGLAAASATLGAVWWIARRT